MHTQSCFTHNDCNFISRHNSYTLAKQNIKTSTIRLLCYMLHQSCLRVDWNQRGGERRRGEGREGRVRRSGRVTNLAEFWWVRGQDCAQNMYFVFIFKGHEGDRVRFVGRDRGSGRGNNSAGRVQKGPRRHLCAAFNEAL